jgi:hypothetical protein
VSWEPSRELAYRTSGGAAIRQSFQVLSLRVWADRVIWALIPAHHDRLAALRADLGRLAAIAEAEATTDAKIKIKIKDEAERARQLLG